MLTDRKLLSDHSSEDLNVTIKRVPAHSHALIHALSVLAHTLTLTHTQTHTHAHTSHTIKTGNNQSNESRATADIRRKDLRDRLLR